MLLKNRVVVALSAILLAGISPLLVGQLSGDSETQDDTLYYLRDIGDFEALFIYHQYEFLRIIPPSPDFILKQPYGPAVPFRWQDFPKQFTDGMIGEYERDNIPLYEIRVYEDPVTREMKFLNDANELIYSIPAPISYNPYSFVSSLYPGIYTGAYSAQEKDWLMALYDPSRVWGIFRLVPLEYAVDYFKPPVQDKSALRDDRKKPDENIVPIRRSSGSTNDIWLSITNLGVTTGIGIEVYVPTVIQTNSMEIYTSEDLITFWWDVTATNLVAGVGSNVISWTHTAAAIGDREYLVYAAANAEVDTDGDSYCDARERFVYHTDLNDEDSYPIEISGSVYYSGNQPGPILVHAATASNVWNSHHVDSISAPGAYIVSGLPNQESYWVNAFRDSNTNELKESWEAWGYYTNAATYVSNSISGVDISLDEVVSINGLLSYEGQQTGLIYIVAVTNAEGWTAPYKTTNATVADYHIVNVPQTNYWIKAYRDSDGNQSNGVYEAYGVHTNNPVAPSNALLGVNVHLIDPDSDEDQLPDSWELYHFGDLDEVAVGDPDADNLSNLLEYQNGANPNDFDSDNDGTDDGTEVEEGTNPLDTLPAVGMNRNWLFHNSAEHSSATWELITRDWRRFLMVDYETGTNSVFMLLPQNVALGPNSSVEVECRISWADQPEGTNWNNAWIDGYFFTTTVVSAETNFHGLPTMGGVTLDVYRVDWEPPSDTNYPIQVYYCPLVKTFTNSTETDYAYLVESLLDGDAGSYGYGSNNWRSGSQYYAGDYSSRDYLLIHDPVRLRNGGFEQAGDDLRWQLSGSDAVVSTNFARSGSSSLLSQDGTGVGYQNIGVLPGEEIVLSGYMLTPATNSVDPNPILDFRYGMMAIEYFNRASDLSIAVQERRLTSTNEHSQWKFFCITSLVPSGAHSANISLRTVSPDMENGSGNAYFDDVSLTVSADTDRDGMPDWWETEYSAVMATNDPSDSIEDADGDSFMNIREYRLKLNPTSSDTDEDGMPDDWEMQYGLNPRWPLDVADDLDGDGLSNLDEYTAGTNPAVMDTDGDGLSDAMEVLDYGSDPLDGDFQGYDLVLEIDGSDAAGTVGTWVVTNTSIYAESRRGYVEYELVITNADVYRIEIEGCDFNDYDSWRRYELRVAVDDVYLERINLYAEDNIPGVAGLYAPWMTAGTHTVRFYWDNASDHKSFKADKVRLQAIDGGDADSDGIKDWVENRLQRLSNVDTDQLTSVVSPICLEGDDPYTEIMSISGGVPVQNGAGDRWYADIALSTNGPVSPEITFQDGGLVITNAIEWVPHNIIEDTNLTIRLNDTVLFEAAPGSVTSGSVSIEIVGVTNYSMNYGESAVHQFNEVGSYTVTGTYTPDIGDPTNRSITVDVMTATFGVNPACWEGVIRTWDCPDMTNDVSIDHDNKMLFGEVISSTPAGRSFQLYLNDPEVHYVVARAGDGGPIITNAFASGFRFGMGSDTYIATKEICGTGDQLIETALVLSPVLDDLNIEGQIIVGGILFDDGSVERSLVATNFNELGEYELRFIRSAYSETSYCNNFSVYQGTNFIGYYKK